MDMTAKSILSKAAHFLDKLNPFTVYGPGIVRKSDLAREKKKQANKKNFR